jgi:hypothetical protein
MRSKIILIRTRFLYASQKPLRKKSRIRIRNSNGFADPCQNISDPETLHFSYKNATWLCWLGEQALDLTENVLDGLLGLVHGGALPEDWALPADGSLVLVPQVRAAL